MRPNARRNGRRGIWLLAGGALLVAPLAVLLWWPRQAVRARAPARHGTTEVAEAKAKKIADPLFPGHPALVDSSRPPSRADWPAVPPSFQYSLPSSKRDGVRPCDTPKPRLPGGAIALPLLKGKILIADPSRFVDRPQFDLVFHIHGDEVVVRELLASDTPFVLITLTLPPNRSYAPIFAGSGVFGHMLDAAEAIVRDRANAKAALRHVLLSAWSSGIEGVRSILYQPEAERVDAVVLIDGLHAPRGERLVKHIGPFVDLAKRAARGDGWMVVTHSSIPTTAFASTTESTHQLIAELGLQPKPVRRDDGFGLELVEYLDEQGLQVRGYAGNDKADHCAQLFLLRKILRVFSEQWT